MTKHQPSDTTPRVVDPDEVVAVQAQLHYDVLALGRLGLQSQALRREYARGLVGTIELGRGPLGVVRVFRGRDR